MTCIVYQFDKVIEIENDGKKDGKCDLSGPGGIALSHVLAELRRFIGK